MKKIHIYTCCCVVLYLITFTSCKKYLTPTPISSFTPEVVFSNVSNARAAVLGAYHSMEGDAGYGIRISLYYTVDNDEMIGPGTTGDNDRRDIAHYLLTPGNLQLANPFNQLYQGVENANLCIYNIPKMAAYSNGTAQEQAQLKRMLGESYILRAQYYYELTKNWGDVPAQWLPSSLQPDLFLKKTDRDTIYNHLLDDLLLAESLMPWRTEVVSIGETLNERFTKGSAKGLRAKIALARGGYALRQNGQMMRGSDYLKYYQIARDECFDLMQHREQHNLNPSYKSIFKDYICAHNPNDPYGEMIMQVGMTSGPNTDSKIGTYHLRLLPTYWYLFDSTDLRRNVTGTPYDMPNDTTKVPHDISNIVDGKFRLEWVSNPKYALGFSYQNLQLNWPLLRFADVLLMFAEADNELKGAPSPEAIAAFKEVSQRGHGGNALLVPAIPADHDGFFKLLVKERALEFGGEGIRKFDLIRWNLLNTALSETEANLTAMSLATPAPVYKSPSYMASQPSYCITGFPSKMYGLTKKNGASDDFYPFANSYYFPAPAAAPTGTTVLNWIGTSTVSKSYSSYYAVGFKSGKSELFPIPQASIDANFNLTQNPGY